MEVTRLFDLLPFQNEKYPKADCFGGKYNGEWKKFSTAECIEISDSIALGLLNIGMKPGDMIAILSENSVEWSLADMGIMKMGGIVVPVYPTSSEKDVAFVFNHAEIKTVFVQTEELYNKVKNILPSTPTVQHVFTFRDVPGAKNYKEILVKGDEAGKAKIKSIQDGIKPGDLATVIYTSGTTGDPKGVMLSHDNIVSNVHATLEILPINHNHKALSFLPLSHIYERMVIYTYMYLGLSIYYAESMEKIGDNLKEIKPQVFTAVPRLLEKVYDKIHAKAADVHGFKRKLFDWAVSMGLRWEPDGKNGWWYEFRLKLLNIVFKKWREGVGGNVIAVCSGSAALQPRLVRVFNAAGIPVVEGYGLTETSPVISVGGFTKGTHKVGYVGRVMTGGQVKIAEDGEILFKGPNLMLGYYKREDLTKEAIDSDGWFHTGDIGELDKDGFLRITDRKKEIFKTSGGKYIAPQVIENKFKESKFIEQIVVIGEYKKFPAALIVPAFVAVKDWLKSKGKSADVSNEDLIKIPEVIKLIKDEVDLKNEPMGNYEKVKKIILLPREFSIEAGEITPTLKLKRKVINTVYAKQIEEMYGE